MHLTQWYHFTNMVAQYFPFLNVFSAAMKYIKLNPATTCSKKDTFQRAVLNEILQFIPVQGRVIKHPILLPCVSLLYTSVAAQQTEWAQVMPFSSPSNLPSNILSEA